MATNRILGLDVGNKYIGIAVSDPLGITAQGYRTYRRQSREEDLAFFTDVIEQFNVKLVVTGLPKEMDGSESKQCRQTRNFCQFLKKRLSVEVAYIDERLTTKASEQVLMEGGVRREKRKAHIDMLAAQLILQTFLDEQQDNEKRHD